MGTGRPWLIHDRRGPSVDRVFDAACDLLLATRTLESQVQRPPDDPSPIAATLGVLDAALRTLGASLPDLEAGAPEGTTDASTLRALERATVALTEAAGAFDAARLSVMAGSNRR
jgi:hypothetical protein